MFLNYLIYPWIKKNIPKIDILYITLNSKNCIKNSLLFLINYNCKYIINSINNGSNSILINSNNILKHGRIIYYRNIPLIFFYNLNIFISKISGRFYNNPSNKLKLIGVTGTNGKTTVTYILSQIINLFGFKSSIIGTLGNGVINNLEKTKNTTDSAVSLQETLYRFNKLKIEFVFIEISSHGIFQNRVKDLTFEYVIFTNISHEHLDYHKNIFNYKICKYNFLKTHKIKKNIIINVDDKFGNFIHKKIFNSIPISIYKKNIITHNLLHLKIKKIIFLNYKSIIKISYNYKIYFFTLKFICKFNINNFILSLVTLILLGFNFNKIIKFSNKIILPKGRLELFKYKNNIKIIVDYAHTPDSIEKLFKNIKKNYQNKIWCIFGCGGNKDEYKRPIIGHIVEKYSNYIILTNDNPRNENPKKIINDIKSGFINNNNKLKIILNRKIAIEYSIKNSNRNDIILILGKGHEEYQIIKNNIFYHSDQIIINNFINK